MPEDPCRPFLLGLTGSIGMGKSTVSAMFRDLGVPVFDSDRAVHDLYAPGGKAVSLVHAAFPGTESPEGGISRELLGKKLMANPEGWKVLESIVHPLVLEEKGRFVADAAAMGQPLVLLDVPLLFEAGADKHCDAVVVVSAPADVQKKRVLAREGMTVEKFEGILGKQMPDGEKRQLADFVIDTGCSLEETKQHVISLLKGLHGREGQAASRLLS